MRGIEEMIQFQCDYEEGACPQILERLVETNLEQTVGYSEDEYCKQAREKIKKACDAPEADVHFLVGGTQTNYVVIRSILRPYQGVISAVTGHINVHETGAVEATGHKVLALPSKDGKITASQVRTYYDAHWNDADHEHIVQPGMVCMKQSGAMLAKGRLLGIQFDTLFTDDLYFKIAAHADKLAMKLKNAFLEKGYKMYFDSYTNQQYPILSKKDREKLAQKYQFSFWEQIDEDYAAVRFCTSWATSEEAIDELIRDI